MTTPVLDLIIMETHNSKLLAVGDASVYPEGFTIAVPTLEISTPSFPTISLPFVAKGIQIYNSDTLGLTSSIETCNDQIALPDGVYTLKYTIAPAYQYNVTKTFLKVDQLYEKIDGMFLSLDISSCDGRIKKQQMDNLDEIEFYIQGAIAEANNCGLQRAIEMYNIANNLADGILNCIN